MGELVKETMESVTEWAESTFGPANEVKMLKRAEAEFDELVTAFYSGEHLEKIAFEAADVVICLYRLICRINPDAIDQKMAINRARKWVVKDGVGQHVKPPVEAPSDGC